VIDAATLRRKLEAHPLGRRMLDEVAAEAYRDGFDEGRQLELGTPTTKREEARRWLRSWWEDHAGGEAPTSGQVYGDARDPGITRRTLDRARADLGLTGHGWAAQLAKLAKPVRDGQEHGRHGQKTES
jgi:hypothetical protein